MHKTFYSLLTFCFVIIISCVTIKFLSVKGLENITLMPSPTGETMVMKEDGESEKEMKMRRKQWYEAMHLAAPGVNWRAIETENMLANYKKTTAERDGDEEKIAAETFANGNITGTWFERGSLNQAGRITACDYYKTGNKLYVLSDAGCLFRGNPDSANWKVLNNDLTFRNATIKVIQSTLNKPRILAALDLNVYYSDDEGVTFNASTGITFPVGWGGNYVSQILALNDVGKTIYVLTRPWDPAPWDARFWLYRSTDQGVSFTKIHTFNEGDDNRLSLWIPFNSSTNVYALGNQPDTGSLSTVYQITGSTVTVKKTSTTLPVNVSCRFKGHKGTVTTLFALTDNSELYSSTDFGSTWTFKSTLPAGGGALGVSVTSANNIAYGGVDAYRSTNGGTSWTKVNSWVDYYGNVEGKLHADIMQIEFFKKKNGTEFGLNMNDGGIYRTDDFHVTNHNLGMKGLNISQYYDVKTEPNGTWVHCGSQDQGFQRTGTLAGNVKTNLTQVISGDYGFLQLTGTNSDHLWTEYPGGKIYYYNNSHSGLSSTYNLPGSFKPLYGWILPTAKLYPLSNNKILITGGNVTGGGGSYLVTLTASAISPYSISGTQFNYDFRANSGNGTSGLSAVETTPLNASALYCATEDGTFFYSTNAGGTWNKTTNFTGPDPQWLHGHAIYASRLTSNLVYYGGSGYSNPAIYKSTDGGITFSPAGIGLPDCVIFDLDANTDETLLFAATSSGPHVYLVSDSTWYPMKGKAAWCEYFSVEYLDVSSTVRFGTYGRGFWDFKITQQPLLSGIENNKFNAEPISVYAYPNPVTDGNIYLKTKKKGNFELRIFDSKGDLVKNGITTSDQKIDVRDLRTGIYFYSCIVGNERESGKFVVN